jgi:acyl carrier protein
MSISQDVEKFLLTETAVDLCKESLNPDEDLLEQGIIDSLGLMRLVVFLEKTFAIEISDEDMVPENFQSLNTITKLVEQRMRGR